MPNYSLLKEKFVSHFGHSNEEIFIFHAPGRVNLIGEHTDYNGGFVFPAALTFGTTLCMRKRTDRRLGLLTTNFQLSGVIDIDTIQYDEQDGWMNYPKGIVKYLIADGMKLEHGFDLLYHGEIPNGSGLSSSASIEVVTAYALKKLNEEQIDLIKLSLLAQKTENEFIGVNSGIMDQFAVANGKKDHAILLMCDTLAYELVPFKSGHYKIVIANTNKRRDLVDSKYNERREQCERAVAQLKQIYPDLTLLGQLSVQQFEQAKHVISDEVVVKRARHVVEEIERVRQSVDALKTNNLEQFGLLMNASHSSLRDLYEVTGHELDSLVSAAQKVTGVLGSRMTGAGFGGCTVSLVHEDSVPDFISQVGEQYFAVTGLKADFYVCEIGNGVEQILV